MQYLEFLVILHKTMVPYMNKICTQSYDPNNPTSVDGIALFGNIA